MSRPVTKEPEPLTTDAPPFDEMADLKARLEAERTARESLEVELRMAGKRVPNLPAFGSRRLVGSVRLTPESRFIPVEEIPDNPRYIEEFKRRCETHNYDQHISAVPETARIVLQEWPQPLDTVIETRDLKVPRGLPTAGGGGAW